MCMCVSYRGVELELPYTDDNVPPTNHGCEMKSPVLGLGYFPPGYRSRSFGHDRNVLHSLFFSVTVLVSCCCYTNTP